MGVQPYQKFSIGTRHVHATLTVVVLLQLLTSQFMEAPRGERLGNWFFEVHEYSGLVAMLLALSFWAIITVRVIGTDAGALVPWFSAFRRAAFREDLARHWTAMKLLRLPDYRSDSPFAAAIHGLGLLLITFMAASGTMYYLAWQAGYEQHPVVRPVVELHEAGASLVYAYVIGHVLMAGLHHYLHEFDMREMWSFRRQPKVRTK